MEMTGGQALARQLVREGVRHVFCVPGVQLDWAIDALADVADRVQLVVPRHEQAASYMADGYARTSGRPGVCMVVPGPGMLNAMAGLATAYACDSPVLALIGQIPSPAIGRGLGLLHELREQSRILGAVTKACAMARAPAEVALQVHEAMARLCSGRRQPVGVEIPPDVLQARAEVALFEGAVDAPGLRPDAVALDQAAGLLREARFPVVIAGGGVRDAAACAALERLADALQAPVVMTENGRGALSDRHRLALTMLGGRCVLPHADVVLAVGTRGVDMRGDPRPARASARRIYLNLFAGDMTAPRPDGLRLLGDAAIGLDELAQRIGRPSSASRAAAVEAVRRWCDEQLAPIEPQLAFVKALRDAIPDDGILVGEMTQVGYVCGVAYPTYRPDSFLGPGYQGTLGFGFPTALGAAMANPGRAVASINGDGGFGWNLQELATAARYRIPVVAVVFNDGAFGNVRRMQRMQFQREYASGLHNPDFLKLADAFGVAATRVTTPRALGAEIRSALASGAPALIEVPVGEMPGPWHLIHPFSKAPRPAPPNPLGEPGPA